MATFGRTARQDVLWGEFNAVRGTVDAGLLSPEDAEYGIEEMLVTENLITNPSFEMNTTGYRTGGTNTIERSTEQVKFDSYSLKCTYQDNITLARYPIALTATDHTLGIWVYVPSGYDGNAPYIRLDNFDPNSANVTVDMTKRDQWQVVSASVALTGPDLAGNPKIHLPAGSPSTGKFIYVDGWQIEEKAYPTPPFDGSFGDGYSWTGTAHASTSIRDAGSYPNITSLALQEEWEAFVAEYAAIHTTNETFG